MVTTIDIPLTFQRTGSNPLDKDSVFATYNDMLLYVNNSSSYAGQICTSLSPFGVYVVKGDKTLLKLSDEMQEVASLPFWSGFTAFPLYTVVGAATITNVNGSMIVEPREALKKFATSNFNYQGNINASYCTGLTSLSVTGCGIFSLDASNCTNLQFLDCSYNTLLQSLSVQNCVHLSELYCQSNIIDVLDVTSLISIQKIIASNNSINSLDVSNKPLLTELDISSCHLSFLGIINCPSLTNINASNNNLPEVVVDSILYNLVEAGRTNGTLNLDSGSHSYNSPPGMSGLYYKQILIDRGWTVLTSAPPNTPATVIFNNQGIPIADGTITGNIPDSWKQDQNIVGYVEIGSSATSIGNFAFYGNQLTSATIPNSVTTVGSYAFFYNQFQSVTIPNSVTSIENWVFSSNQLQSVTIPNSVTSIGNGAFYNNQLTSVTIPNSVTIIGNNAFDTNSLTSVTIPNSVTTIGSGAFYGNQLQSVTIPNSVTSIRNGAFSTNQLQSVTIPNSVTSIGSEAFRYNQLTSVTIGNSLTSIESETFSNNRLTSVTIPNSVTSIGSAAFYGNQLLSVTIGNSVTSIGVYAFNYNPQLSEVTIPSSVTTIGDRAFGYTLLSAVSCYADYNAFTGSDVFIATTSPLTIYVKASDPSWTAGSIGSFQGNDNVIIVKDLP